MHEIYSAVPLISAPHSNNSSRASSRRSWFRMDDDADKRRTILIVAAAGILFTGLALVVIFLLSPSMSSPLPVSHSLQNGSSEMPMSPSSSSLRGRLLDLNTSAGTGTGTGTYNTDNKNNNIMIQEHHEHHEQKYLPQQGIQIKRLITTTSSSNSFGTTTKSTSTFSSSSSSSSFSSFVQEVVTVQHEHEPGEDHNDGRDMDIYGDTDVGTTGGIISIMRTSSISTSNGNDLHEDQDDHGADTHSEYYYEVDNLLGKEVNVEYDDDWAADENEDEDEASSFETAIE